MKQTIKKHDTSFFFNSKRQFNQYVLDVNFYYFVDQITDDTYRIHIYDSSVSDILINQSCKNRTQVDIFYLKYDSSSKTLSYSTSKTNINRIVHFVKPITKHEYEDIIAEKLEKERMTAIFELEERIVKITNDAKNTDTIHRNCEPFERIVKATIHRHYHTLKKSEIDRGLVLFSDDSNGITSYEKFGVITHYDRKNKVELTDLTKEDTLAAIKQYVNKCTGNNDDEEALAKISELLKGLGI